VDGYLKRAADSNTVDLAKSNLTVALTNIESNSWTSGYTSVIYRTPDEDIGFWYTNLKDSLGELNKLSPEASQLEKTNVLMKLRETLLDKGSSGENITSPDGISVYPYNASWAFLAFIGLALLPLSVYLIVSYLDD
jgi:hypothetical protein